MKACNRCGNALGETDRVCRSCGKAAISVVAPPSVEVDLDRTVDRSVLARLVAAEVDPAAHGTVGPGVSAGGEDAVAAATPSGPDSTSKEPASPALSPAEPSAALPAVGDPILSAPFWTRVRASWKIPPGVPSPPRQLWAVIGMLGLVGTASAGWSIYWAVNALDLFSFGSVGAAFGAFVLGVVAIPFCFGLGCVYLARRLQASDRVARVLAVVLCLSAAAAFILTGARDLTLVLVALGCIGAAVTLLVDPTTRNHFTGPHAVHGSEPSPVVAARVLMVIVGCCIFLVGVMMLPLSEIDGALAVYGLLEIGIATLVFWLSQRLSRGDPAARVFVTALALLYSVLSLLAGHGQPGVILPVGLAIGTVGLLWVPRSSRLYFASLPRPTQPAVAAAERAIESMIASLTAAGSTGGGDRA